MLLYKSIHIIYVALNSLLVHKELMDVLNVILLRKQHTVRGWNSAALQIVMFN